MDETLSELVSRYLDGDLDEAETARLEERARTDAELAAEIDSGHRLREAVAGLADRMTVPATLDKVMEPLRRSESVPAQRVRPAYRWLGAAAAIVLGITVAMEVAQRNPEPSLSRPSAQRTRPVNEREEIFKLAPLPTANPNETRPLGATDRLLEEEPVQPAPPEPQPLEVIGPLPAGEPMVDTGKSFRAIASAGREDLPSSVVLRIDGVEIWAGSVPVCAAAWRRLRIEVREGRVVSVEFIHQTRGKNGIVHDDTCLPNELLGSSVSGVLDGVHVAELVVADRTR